MTTTTNDKDEYSSTTEIWVRGYKQAPITASPLAYRAKKSKKVMDTTVFGSYPPAPSQRMWQGSIGYSRPNGALNIIGYKNGSSGQPLEARLVYNKAFERFKAQIGPSSTLGTTVTEAGSALAMIALRAHTLRSSYRALKKGNFKEFITTLKARPLRRHGGTMWTRPKDASSLWLEYWFGWAPLVGDIGSSIDVLQSAPPVGLTKVSGSAKMPISYAGSASAGNGFYSRKSRSYIHGEVRAKIGAFLTVSNPNLYLANQLGFVNPTSIAWEVVPFSFLVDWFANVGNVLDSLSWDVGLTVTGGYSTVYWSEVTRVETAYKQPLTGTLYDGTLLELSDTHVMRRDVGIALPSLTMTLPNGLSTTRAATAISLLTSIFTKG